MAFRKRGKKSELPPPPGGLPLPPPPGDLPPPPEATDAISDLPTPPEPPEEPLVVDDVEEASDDEIEVVDDDDDLDYADLWKNRTDKTLQQMYGHIDRLGSGDVGTLLERYSDRFGHELDREIIVMRKSEKESVRDSAPVVELISTPDAEEEEVEGDSDDMEELEGLLASLESEMRPLKQQFDAAKKKGQKSKAQKLGKKLKPMATQRKLIKAVIAGDEDISALEELEESHSTDDDSDDEFPRFFDVVNALLGEMPDEFVTEFIQTKNFELFQKVGDDPGAADDKLRKKFFQMVNNELGTMPDDLLQSFMESPDFQLFVVMGEIYGA